MYGLLLAVLCDVYLMKQFLIFFKFFEKFGYEVFNNEC